MAWYCTDWNGRSAPLFESSDVRVFVQARMTSTRFPGKVLAPFNGRPLIAQLLSRLEQAAPRARIVVTTSTDPTDDPLACYIHQLGFAAHRGALDDVFGRFRACLQEFPCDWFFRICADSPLLDVGLLTAMLPLTAEGQPDLITNVQKRTYPKGHSVELLRARSFADLDPARLSADDKEHVTRFFYQHPTEFVIRNLESGNPALLNQSFVVDTLEDHRRLQELVHRGEAC